jgi:3-methyl-2-oxobutanoate hydroxymethyltransferase
MQGKTEAEAEKLRADARALEDAGVFGLVLECLPSGLAEQITSSVGVPTIGIGAGPACDGQILVIHDLLGIPTGVNPPFVKRYAEIGDAMRAAFADYRREVETGVFPPALRSR